MTATTYTLTSETIVETDEGARCTWGDMLAANADGEMDVAETEAALREHGRAVVGMGDVIRIAAA
jgi:hypothetical protein